MYDAKDYEEAAKHLSKYTGNMEDMTGYTGEGDPSLFNFNGEQAGFSSNRTNTYSFTIQNNRADERDVLLTPSYLGLYEDAATGLAAINNATGINADAILTDGNFDGDGADPEKFIVGTAGNSGLTIDNLQKFISLNPTSLQRIIIKANTTEFFENSLVMGFASPARNLGTEEVQLTDFISPDQQDNTKAVINVPIDMPTFQFDNQRLLMVRMGGTDVVASTGVKVTLTLKFGPMINESAALAHKRAAATANGAFCRTQ